MSIAIPIARSSRKSEVVYATLGQTVFSVTAFSIWDTVDLRVERKLSNGLWGVLNSGFTVTKTNPNDFYSTVTVTLAVGAFAGDKYRFSAARVHERLQDVTAGGIINSATLERELDRTATILQEIRRDLDERVAIDPDGLAFNVRGARVINAADPVDDQDLITKKWALDTETTLTGQAAASAESARASSAAAGIASGRLIVGSFAQVATKFVYANPDEDQVQVAAGDIIFWPEKAISWRVQSLVVVTPHLDYTADGGIKVDVLPGEHGYNVLAFGAAGDGSADDEDALIAWAAALPVNNARGFIPPGVYMSGVSTAYGILFDGKTNFEISAYGATIKAEDGAAAVANGTLMWFEDCFHGVIRGLRLDGNLPNRTGSEPAGAHNLKIRSCHDLVFEQLHSLNAVTDAAYVDTATPGFLSTVPSDVVFDRCVMDGAYRNNLTSIQSLRLRVFFGRYTNAVGTAPMAGIDLEDNGTIGNVDPLIFGAHFSGNGGRGIDATGVYGCDDVEIAGCDFGNNGKGSIVVGLCRGIKIRDCKHVNVSDVVRAIIDVISASTTNLEIIGQSFIDCDIGNFYEIYIHSSVLGPAKVSGVYSKGGSGQVMQVDPAKSDISDITVLGNTNATATGNINGARSTVRDWTEKNCTSKLIVSAADAVVDGFYSEDCPNTSNALFMAGVRPTLRNAKVHQTTSIPSGQKAFAFLYAPLEISNVSAYSAGTDYTGANVLNLIGGVSANTILNAIRPGYYSGGGVNTGVGDASATLTWGLSKQTAFWGTTLTADRTVTLATANAPEGASFKICRTAGGAFNLNVGSGPLKALAAGQWAEVTYNGSAWQLTGSGNL